ncbi:MAG: VTT domain-containing protein [Phycisphaerae bacterium]|nr:VTT domain-containing protein [Phycisphaerae bacterium]MDW8263249.1 VTT domain-containing protein [Phycisphaerales bacterium]
MDTVSEQQAGVRSFREHFRRLGPAGWLAIMALTVPPLGWMTLLYFINPVSQWLRGHGGLGPLIYSGAFIPLGGLNLLPTYVYSGLGGWSFGFSTGLTAAMVGIMLASFLAYGVGRAASGDRVVRLLEEKPKWRAIYDALLRSSFGRTLWIVTLLRLPPNSPFALTNLVLSSARTQPAAYALGTLAGMLPRTALVVWFGSHVGGDEFRISEQRWAFWVGLAAAILVIAIVGHMAHQAVQRVTEPSNGMRASRPLESSTEITRS